MLIIVLDWLSLLRTPKSWLIEFSLPLEAAFRDIGLKTSSETRFWLNFLRVKDENTRLQKQVEDLQSKLSRSREIERENGLLREQLKVRELVNRPGLVLGRIVGKVSEDPTKMILNQGTRSGLKAGDLVIYKNYIFGKVGELGETAAKVTLLTDPGSFFNAVDIEGSFTRGEVRGNFGTSLKMEKILPTEKINLGDVIIDSDSGYILGKVVWVEGEGAGILRSADLTVPYEIEKVEKVFVVVP